ncbi:hypothetical protein E4U32_007789 [Claviceps aff. humidiphila group G2b]|nr:hypothetical protein E4U32_007789 [Claviceps aff. humidiphila group G2b]
MSTVLRIRGIRAGYAKAKAMMTSLLTVKSSRAFYKLCGNIARKWPRLSDWVRHKKQRFIISGLTRACSPLSDEDWHTIGSNTNGVESQHQKAYTEGGQFVSLIEAVKSGQYIDGNSSAKFYNYTKTGKRDRYRNTTAEGREDLSQKRYDQVRRIRIEREGGFETNQESSIPESAGLSLLGESLSQDLPA